MTIRWTIRCHGGQFGVSSSLLLASSRTIRCQFIIIACIKLVSWIQTIRCQFIIIACIKSVSWIHGKTSKTDRR